MEQLQISPQKFRLLCGISFSLTNILKIDKKMFSCGGTSTLFVLLLSTTLILVSTGSFASSQCL